MRTKFRHLQDLAFLAGDSPEDVDRAYRKFKELLWTPRAISAIKQLGLSRLQFWIVPNRAKFVKVLWALSQIEYPPNRYCFTAEILGRRGLFILETMNAIRERESK